jgi:hypothetical protein
MTWLAPGCALSLCARAPPPPPRSERCRVELKLASRMQANTAAAATLQLVLTAAGLLFLHMDSVAARVFSAGTGVEGRAAPGSTVVAGAARFTVLTSALIRMEWVEKPLTFDDEPSLIFQNRATPPVAYQAERNGSGVVITTSLVRLAFRPEPGDSGFSATNLQVDFVLNSTHRGAWTPGMQDTGNLKGTLSSMDCYDDPAKCQATARSRLGAGLLSRDGWALVDDVQTARWTTEQGSATSRWRWWKAPAGSGGGRPLSPLQHRPSSAPAAHSVRSDCYGFFHGHNYTLALGDFALVAGKMDMPPLSAFGVWWSRYWVYSVGVPAIAQDIIADVLDGYAAHALPLNHVVMDMDWHRWDSQYTWNTTIVPDPDAWMSSLHSHSNALRHPLKFLVNLHPNGVGTNEKYYDNFSRQVGSKLKGPTYKCDLSNAYFASAYFDWMMGAAGQQASPNNQVDYWWTDWGGCGHAPGVSNLWWGNYLYHQDKSRMGVSRAFSSWKRPILTEIYLCHACSYHACSYHACSCRN